MNHGLPWRRAHGQRRSHGNEFSSAEFEAVVAGAGIGSAHAHLPLWLSAIEDGPLLAALSRITSRGRSRTRPSRSPSRCPPTPPPRVDPLLRCALLVVMAGGRGT